MNDDYTDLKARMDAEPARKRKKAATKPRKQTLSRYMDEVLSGNDGAVIPDSVVGTLPHESDKQRLHRLMLELVVELALKGTL